MFLNPLDVFPDRSRSLVANEIHGLVTEAVGVG
jgi:hypothetical protein